eukprot:6052679-Pleurochrysis_carterae.AAC.5
MRNGDINASGAAAAIVKKVRKLRMPTRCEVRRAVNSVRDDGMRGRSGARWFRREAMRCVEISARASGSWARLQP